jgi:hypothetical protein
LRWDEVTGVARAAALLHSSEELSTWARLLTGNESLGLISEPGPRELVRAALWDWLNGWRAENLLETFAALPDEGLTTRIWNLAATVRKSFGMASEAVEDAFSDNISLEESLQRVADAFGDTVENFSTASVVLSQLRSYCKGLIAREEARRYLLAAEPAEWSELESARRELLCICEDVHNLLDPESNRRFDLLWREFQGRYVDYYTRAHDAHVGNLSDRSGLNALLASDEWHNFEALSKLSIVNREFGERARGLLEGARHSKCNLPVRRLLETKPYCACFFRLARARAAEQIVSELEEVMRLGIKSHLETLATWGRNLAMALNIMAEQHAEEHVKESAQTLATKLAATAHHDGLSLREVELIELALQSGGVPPLRVEMPEALSGLQTREELKARLDQWLDGLPNYPALVDFVTRSESNAG